MTIAETLQVRYTEFPIGRIFGEFKGTLAFRMRGARQFRWG